MSPFRQATLPRSFNRHLIVSVHHSDEDRGSRRTFQKDLAKLSML